jgi:hypothetical protein
MKSWSQETENIQNICTIDQDFSELMLRRPFLLNKNSNDSFKVEGDDHFENDLKLEAGENKISEFLGDDETESTEIDSLLSEMDQSNFTCPFKIGNAEDETTSEILGILKRHPNTTKHVKREGKFSGRFQTMQPTQPLKRISLQGRILNSNLENSVKQVPVRSTNPFSKNFN